MPPAINEERVQSAFPPELAYQPIEINQKTDLANLMLAAYRGTTDDEGGSRPDARDELTEFFSGQYGTPLLADSSVLTDQKSQQMISAICITQWSKTQQPLISYIMTHPEWKRKHLAKYLLENTIHDLSQQSWTHIDAVITEGNTASERLFHAAGFRKINE